MSNPNHIYLDYNATTPVDENVFDAMVPFFKNSFANASSHTHFPGRQAAQAVEEARKQIAQMLDCDVSEIIFTSGSTESINMAIKGVAKTYQSKGNHFITWKTEHKAVLDSHKYLESLGCRVSYLNVSREGLPDLDELEKTISKETILVSKMMANNETGVISPIEAISEICRDKNILLFSDATQCPGKIQINVNSQGVDLLSLSAHKMYGPKGVGILYKRRKNPRVQLSPLLHGGGHENGLRSGTYNVPGIVGMGKAAELCLLHYWDDTTRMSKLRTLIEQTLTDNGLGFINGSMKNRLPNTTNILLKNVQASDIISKLPELAFSTGSACTSELPEPSHVLTAMGLSEKEVKSSIRISIGRQTTIEEIITASDQLKSTIQLLQKNNILL